MTHLALSLHEVPETRTVTAERVVYSALSGSSLNGLSLNGLSLNGLSLNYLPLNTGLPKSSVSR
jgi:hypothetical protein